MEKYTTKNGTEVFLVGKIKEKKTTYVVGQTMGGARFNIAEEQFNKLFTKIQEK